VTPKDEDDYDFLCWYRGPDSSGIPAKGRLNETIVVVVDFGFGYFDVWRCEKGIWFLGSRDLKIDIKNWFLVKQWMLIDQREHENDNSN
jgi:hypothetical protein